jgi:hypothetical protein
MEAKQSINPFDQIDFRLARIEETLNLIATKEQLEAEIKRHPVTKTHQKLTVLGVTLHKNIRTETISSKIVRNHVSRLQYQAKLKANKKSSINKLLDFIALILRFCLLLH